jgi:hypothetical protein
MHAVGFEGQKASFEDSRTKIWETDLSKNRGGHRDRVAAVLISPAFKMGMPECGTKFLNKVRSIASSSRPFTDDFVPIEIDSPAAKRALNKAETYTIIKAALGALASTKAKLSPPTSKEVTKGSRHPSAGATNADVGPTQDDSEDDSNHVTP